MMTILEKRFQNKGKAIKDIVINEGSILKNIKKYQKLQKKGFVSSSLFIEKL